MAKAYYNNSLTAGAKWGAPALASGPAAAYAPFVRYCPQGHDSG